MDFELQNSSLKRNTNWKVFKYKFLHCSSTSSFERIFKFHITKRIWTFFRGIQILCAIMPNNIREEMKAYLLLLTYFLKDQCLWVKRFDEFWWLGKDSKHGDRWEECLKISIKLSLQPENIKQLSVNCLMDVAKPWLGQ